MKNPIQILHLSDLHFGRITESVLLSLKNFIEQHKSHLHMLILTGDLTQRAKSHEFHMARQFLEQLPVKVFLVPGNHDIPLYNLYLRFFHPYRKFCQHLGPFSNQYYEDDHFIIYGLWTTDNFSVKDPMIKKQELKHAVEVMKKSSSSKFKIIASHHPLASDQQIFHKEVNELILSGTHLFLSGHDHQSHIHQIHPGAYSVSSGTSTSSRTRKEVNSFNLITINPPHTEIEIFHHSPETNEFRSSTREPLVFT